jgi:hypothetical protein
MGIACATCSNESTPDANVTTQDSRNRRLGNESSGFTKSSPASILQGRNEEDWEMQFSFLVGRHPLERKMTARGPTNALQASIDDTNIHNNSCDAAIVERNDKCLKMFILKAECTAGCPSWSTVGMKNSHSPVEIFGTLRARERDVKVLF